jgi:hypothetical protein
VKAADISLPARLEVYTKFHRIDGGKPWIDIRFDKIMSPSNDATVRVDGTR